VKQLEELRHREGRTPIAILNIPTLVHFGFGCSNRHIHNPKLVNVLADDAGTPEKAEENVATVVVALRDRVSEKGVKWEVDIARWIRLSERTPSVREQISAGDVNCLGEGHPPIVDLIKRSQSKGELKDTLHREMNISTNSQGIAAPQVDNRNPNDPFCLMDDCIDLGPG